MFNANNNQALQLTLQGYSNSINTAQNNGVGNAMRNFNQTLGNAADGYYQREQAQRNIKATEAQTRGQELANEFNQRNMDTALGQEKQRLRGMRLGNDYQGYVNEVKAGTKGTEIKAMNSTNLNTKANKDLDTTITNLQHDTYKGGYSMYDSKGHAITSEEQLQKALQEGGGGVFKYEKNKKGENEKVGITSNEANRNFALSQEVAQNKKAVQDAHRGGNYTTANQAQAATLHSDIQKQQADDSYGAYSEGLALSRNLGQSALDRATDYNNGVFLTTDPQTGKQVATPAAVQGYSNQIANSNTNTNINSVNIQNRDRTTQAQEKANNLYDVSEASQNIMNAFRQNPNMSVDAMMQQYNTPEVKQQAAYVASNVKRKEYENAINSIMNAKLQGEIFNDLADSSRLEIGIGKLAQVFGTDYAQQFTKVDTAQKQALVTLASASLKGSLSDRDMKIIEGMLPSMWVSESAQLGRAKQIMKQNIYNMEAKLAAAGGPAVLSLNPEIQREYFNALKLYSMLDR